MSSNFKIHTGAEPGPDARLFIEISPRGIAFAVIDNGNECIGLHGINFNAENDFEKAADSLKQLVAEEPLLHENYSSTTVIYACKTAVLVPGAYFPSDKRKEVIELVHGDMNDVFVRTDFMYRENIHNVYTISKTMDAVVSYLFSSPSCTHLYSLMPSMYNDEGNSLYCIFGTTCFTVMLKKDNQLQAIQTYYFKTPEDVVFYLLQLCESFGCDVSSVKLQLCGMIDESSSLFSTLYKYFLQVSFNDLPDNFIYPAGIDDFPAHYFSHLFAAASCV